MRIVLLLSALLLLTPFAPAAEAIDPKAVDAIVEAGMKSWQVPGVALAIVRDQKVVYVKGYGVREVGTDHAVSPDTLFAIASCSKAFTAAAAGVLVDEGRLAWDDPVRKHLPWFQLSDPLADRSVTIRDLLCHRTGLASHDLLWIATDLDRETIVRRTRFLEPSHSFRSTFLYNNTMYCAAGLAVGAASRSSWEEVVTRRLFDPLGMKSATCSVRAAGKTPDHALPHARIKDDTAHVLPWHDMLEKVGPAGSIHASVRDMARWVRFQLGDGTFEGRRILKAGTLAEMHTPQMVVRREGVIQTAYPDTMQVAAGLGWFVHDYRGQPMISHTGGLEGFRARVVLVPRKKLGLVLLMNSGVGSSYASMHYVVSNNLLDLLLGLEKKDWNQHYQAGAKKLRAAGEAALRESERKRHPDTKPSRELSAYTGTYKDAAYGTARLTLHDGKLILGWGKWKYRLEHFHYDTFMARVEPPEQTRQVDRVAVRFVLEPDGEVGSVHFQSRRFERVGKQGER
jgi:CubicO group peptidase (beta-lactamase class C family)